MLVMVFVTDDGTADGTGPLLFTGEWPDGALPANPRGYEWRYFATVDIEDQLIGAERDKVQASLADRQPFVSQRLI